MRKLLVTGSSGLIGSRVVALAAQSGFEIVPLHRGGGADICDAHSLQGAVAAVADAAALVHLAAFTDVSAAHQQDGDKHGACFQVNVCGTENVAAACRAASLPWVHVSTDFVFGGGKVEPYTEADTPDPIEWYGRTKLDAEHVARDAGATIARVSFPYSVPPAPKPDLVRWVVGALRDGKELRLFDDQYITPTFVDDIATALLILA
ncbi:MAG: sugar nucleotide-binding protein, partial [Planctomycetota bacterium]